MGGGGDGDSEGADFTFYSSLSTSYLGPFQPNKTVLEKARDVNNAAMISEIDCSMRTHTDNLVRAIDGLSMCLLQLDSRAHQLELSVDDLKVSVRNNHQSTEGEFRLMENVILQVQSSVEDLKVKQEDINAQMKLDKLHILKVQTNPSEQTTPTPQQFNTQQIVHPPVQLPTPSPPAQTSYFPQLDTLFPSANQTQQDVPSYERLNHPARQQQPEALPSPEHQLIPFPPYPQAVHKPSQTYPPSFHQPSSPPLNQLLGSAPPSHMYESLIGGFSSGPSSVYSPTRYGNNLAPIYQPHGTGGDNYPQAGLGNRVHVDDVVNKVTSMGFPREYVGETVRKLMDNGEAVDLNFILDKLMNDGGVQPRRG